MALFSQRPRWILLSIASGTCAALNGVFAKLTTTELTSQLVTFLVERTRFNNLRSVIEVVTRVVFFSLNLILNGVMWALFTKALAQSTSTTKVSIINTSSNFMITAILGRLIFSENLSRLWFIGAFLLVMGNVIIGRRENDHKTDLTKEDYVEGEQQHLTGQDEFNHDQNLEVKDKNVEDDILDVGSEDSNESDKD
ncbi:hypothetical protein HI914_03972 [Erysiphe necator]|nr:hypothetical protein HI914_03972 [Erysiphe necator]